ncbi:MAG: penicillin-binding transpeptidase domain-containing protein [Myxococcota bacterium]
MLTSRPPRNRYRRRPSRLTALGKGVVASTVTGMLALGWASQASRHPDAPPAAEAVPAPRAEPGPVSAPPRWAGAPSFGAIAAPERDAIPADPHEPVRAPAAAPDPAALAVEPAPTGAASASPTSTGPTSTGPGRTAAVPADGLRLVAPPTSRARFEKARAHAGAGTSRAVASGRPRLAEWVEPAALGLPAVASAAANGAPGGPAAGRVRVEYSLDEALTDRVFEILRNGRVERGIAIVIDPRTGRLLAYATTDPNVLPVERAYPAASIVKVVTAAAMLEQRPDPAAWDCLYEGNKYRLSQRRLDRPKRGNHASLEDALASSNNQCFSQWAIHGLGEPRLRRMLDLFGWSGVPAIGHSPGRVEPAATRFDLGQLGSGLDGVRVTPLHVASLATVLADGRFATPRWIDRVVDAEERAIPMPRPELPRRVVSPRTAENLRELMVATTKRGTARRAFRTRRGVPVLGSIDVAGKTGNLNGSNPPGRYEWFFGVAPAKDPKIGVVVLQVHGHLWWARSSELAANILREVFCERSSCRPELALRFTGSDASRSGPVLVSDLDASAGRAASRAGDPAVHD